MKDWVVFLKHILWFYILGYVEVFILFSAVGYNERALINPISRDGGMILMVAILGGVSTFLSLHGEEEK